MPIFNKLGRLAYSTGGLVLIQRSLQACFSLVTVFVIAYYLSPSMQGWYYGFLSLASLYVLFDLGTERALVARFARESVGLGEITFDVCEAINAEALRETLARSVRWYCLMASLFMACLWPLGIWFFSGVNTNNLASDWALPWVILVATTGGMLVMTPFLAFLEGIGFVKWVTRLRLLQALAGALFSWGCLINGSALWATLALAGSFCVVTVLGLVWRWPGLFRIGFSGLLPGLRHPAKLGILDSRVAVSWVCMYLTTQAYTLLLMRMDGPVSAGQFGLSMALVNMVGVLALSTAASRTAALSKMAKLGEGPSFSRGLYTDMVFFLAFFGCALIGFGFVQLWFPDNQFLSRILPLWELGLLFVFIFSVHLMGLFTVYLRSYLKEPLTKVQFFSTALLLPSTTVAASYFSSAGVVVVLFCGSVFMILPWAIFIFRAELKSILLSNPADS